MLEIIGGLTALLAAIGGGFRWVMVWSDKKVTHVQDLLERQYAERFSLLEEKLSAQSLEIRQNREDVARYLRHVGILEGLLSANGIDVPPMGQHSNP